MWYIYLLHNIVTNHTYIGCSTDPHRRLRQHRRELSGGAKATLNHCRQWQLVLILSGFENKSAAMRWEKIIKSRTKGLVNRTIAFQGLVEGICPGNGKYYEVPKNIKLEKLR